MIAIARRKTALLLATALTALVAGSANGQEAADAPKLPKPSRDGSPPALKVRGQVIETKGQLYDKQRLGEPTVSGYDVSSEKYRPELAIAGERSGPVEIDRDELRRKTLALYGRPAAAAVVTTTRAHAPEAEVPSPPAAEQAPAGQNRWSIVGSILVALLLGAVLQMRRRAARTSPVHSE